ncbi:MAG: hypothetical protein ABIG95_03305 [Candidatus Woesearchaeota archaeon]
MSIAPLIILLVIVVVILLIKRLLKAVATLIFIVLIVASLILLFSYLDLQDLQRHYSNSSSLFLRQKDGVIIDGLHLNGLSFNDFLEIDQEKIDLINTDYQAGSLAANLVGNYKIFIADAALFGSRPITDEFSDAVNAEGPGFVYKNIKESLIVVIPETPFFMVYRRFPGLITLWSEPAK